MTKVLVWLAVVASCVVCAWSGHRYLDARSDASVALHQLELVSTDAREIASVRAAAPPESRRNRPPPGLTTRVANVVSKAGLPQPTLQNLSPENETSVGGSNLRKQTAKMTLEPLTLPELGKFLEEWRNAEPVWTMTSIDITPTRGKAAADRPLRAIIGIETVFADSKEGNR